MSLYVADSAEARERPLMPHEAAGHIDSKVF